MSMPKTEQFNPKGYVVCLKFEIQVQNGCFCPYKAYVKTTQKELIELMEISKDNFYSIVYGGHFKKTNELRAWAKVLDVFVEKVIKYNNWEPDKVEIKDYYWFSYDLII